MDSAFLFFFFFGSHLGPGWERRTRGRKRRRETVDAPGADETWTCAGYIKGRATWTGHMRRRHDIGGDVRRMYVPTKERRVFFFPPVTL